MLATGEALHLQVAAAELYHSYPNAVHICS